VLAAKGRPGDSEKYTLKFRWAKDYEVFAMFFEDGGFDVNVVPGMTVQLISRRNFLCAL
jgi:hypothetical protein